MKSNNTLRKLDNYAVPYLYMIILICTIIGYVVRYTAPALYSNLILIPHMVVLKHQYWRLFTWIFTTPYDLSGLMIVFLPINLYFYFSLGRLLEMYWGRFMYNLYVFGGMLLTNIVVVLGAYYRYVWSPNASTNILIDVNYNYGYFAAYGVTRYMLMSIFLAFSVIGGENMVYMYFVIPLKMKWLAYLDLFFILYAVLAGMYFTKLIALSSVINFFIYYLINKGKAGPSLEQRKRRREFEKKKKGSGGTMFRKKPEVEYNPDGTIKFQGKGKGGIIPPGFGNPDGISIHKCAVCGRTEKDDPNLEFRFCSKCNGNYEYCSEHLYTHQHIN